MGNDGGSIPTRRELVKEAARNPNTSELKASILESQTHAWTSCPLSQRPLATPIVSDCAGMLYNKDAIIEYLLPSDGASSNSIKVEQEEMLAGRIKSLRDVVEVRFQTEESDSGKGEKRICPVTSKELGPHTKGVYLVPCGHAFSDSAMKEVADNTCIQCNEPYEKENIIPILPLVQEDILRLEERIRRLKHNGLSHSLKKAPGSKKRKKNGTNDIKASIANGTHDEVLTHLAVDKLKASHAESCKLSTSNGETPEPPSRSGTVTPVGGIKNAATASLTARVLDEQEERNKRRKLGLNENLKSLFSTTGAHGSTPQGGDFMTRGFSIPKKA